MQKDQKFNTIGIYEIPFQTHTETDRHRLIYTHTPPESRRGRERTVLLQQFFSCRGR